MPPKITKIIKVVKRKQTKKKTKTKIYRKRRRNTKSRMKMTPTLTDQYIRCLNNPFEEIPVPVGFGTMVPTQVHSAYFRNSFQTNTTDGSFDLVVIPNLQQMVMQNTAGLAVLGAPTVYPATNFAALKAVCSAARVLSMAVRVYPNIALTNPPGFVAIGLIPAIDDLEFGNPSAPGATTFLGAPTYNKFAMPQVQIHKASGGNNGCIEVLWRPQDLTSFEFDFDDVFGLPYFGSGIVSGPYLLVAGQSLPPNTQIYYEVILHLETTIGFKSTSTAVDDAASQYPSIKSQTSISSPEQLMQFVSPSLTSSSHILADVAAFGGKAYAAARTAHEVLTAARGIADGMAGRN